VIEEQKRGVPARLYYRVKWDAIFALLDPSQDAGNLQSRMRETRGQERTLPAPLPAGNVRSISESTQRLQTESLFEDSKGQPSGVDKYDQVRLAILPYAEDLARELNDQAPLASTTTRLTNLYRGSGLDLDTFVDLLIAARQITQERTSVIRTPRPDGIGPKPKMPYFLTVLEDLIGQTQASTGTGSD
jgi:hypothetical protein